MSDNKQKPCKCIQLNINSLNGKEVTYSCNCGQTRWARLLTPAEAKKVNHANKRSSENAGSVHKLSHEFDRRFKQTTQGGWKLVKRKNNKISFKFDKKIKRKGDGDWRWVGYEMIERMEDFQKRHREIETVRVDDSYFASSDLAFIPHNSGNDWMGYTALYMPQCTGEKPIEFFLYPHMLKNLIATLQRMAKRIRKSGDRHLTGRRGGYGSRDRKPQPPFSYFKPILKSSAK